MVYIPNTIVDLPNTMADLPNTVVDIPIIPKRPSYQKKYLNVQGIQKVPKGPLYPKDT